MDGCAEKTQTANKGPRLRAKPDVVIVKSEAISYADLLKRIKTDNSLKELVQNINALNKTKEDHLKIVLNQQIQDAEGMNLAISKAIESEANCIRLSDNTKLEILDPNEETTDDEILEASRKEQEKQTPQRYLASGKHHVGLFQSPSRSRRGKRRLSSSQN